jgi:Polyketide cyclase / dehydrase and lipid transport
MAERTSGSATIAAPAHAVMSVIADFAAYPQWAGVQSAEVVEPGADGRARLVRFGLDAGLIKDRFVLRWDWDGDRQARWELAEPGSVISQMSGAYLLTGRDGSTEVTFALAAGVRIPLIGPVRRRVEKAIIGAALRGLAARVEAQGSGPA